MRRPVSFDGNRLLATALIIAGVSGCGANGKSTTDAPDLGPAFTMGTKPLSGPPKNTVGGFTITVPTNTLTPGDETLPCYIFPLDITGPSRLVGGGVLTTTPGLHHGNVTTRKKTGDGIRVCSAADAADGLGEALDVVNGGSVLFGSSTQIVGQEWQHFPDGMAFRVGDDQEIVARLHYLNASNATITLAPSYQWFTIDESTLTTELAPFAWEYQTFTIPPLSRTTVTGSCMLPRPMNIVSALPHMHRMGVEFDVGFMGGPLDGQQFVSSKGYDPQDGVLLEFNPAIDLWQGGKGLGATFSCTWQNTLDQTLVDGVGNNEMCILFGYAYPVANTFSALAGDGWCIPTTASPTTVSGPDGGAPATTDGG